jgi:hypothetical protein
MSTHDPNEYDRKAQEREEAGYELTDVSVPGIAVFLIALLISVGVFFVFCFGMGKVINTALLHADGPPNKWTRANMPVQSTMQMQSNPQMEQKQLAVLTHAFPTPRLQQDDGNLDVAELHEREDLWLNYYSWVDESKGTVRVPIERAMELIAERGLPVAPQPQQVALMFGDSRPVITLPLTDGFAPTAFEQELHGPTRLPGEQASSEANNR